MMGSMKYYRQLCGEVAGLSFLTFILLALLDDLLPGFVYLYFSPAVFLASAVVALSFWLGLTLGLRRG